MYNTVNYFEQGSGKLVLNGPVEFGPDYAPEGDAVPIAAVGDHVATLAGSLTGSTDGTVVDIAAVSTAGGNTYSDAAINATITSANLQNKELQAKLNALITSLQDAGILASS